ncbi:MAG: hypothetical protein EBY22_05630, partial [Gammaproteobacteria bacterium]|nr:hypothetical protein [Gammaproteobacteria bacterium]
FHKFSIKQAILTVGIALVAQSAFASTVMTACPSTEMLKNLMVIIQKVILPAGFPYRSAQVERGCNYYQIKANSVLGQSYSCSLALRDKNVVN